MNYSEWFEAKMNGGNDLENGFIESRQIEFDRYCLEEWEQEEADEGGN